MLKTIKLILVLFILIIATFLLIHFHEEKEIMDCKIIKNNICIDETNKYFCCDVLKQQCLMPEVCYEKISMRTQ